MYGTGAIWMSVCLSVCAAENGTHLANWFGPIWTDFSELTRLVFANEYLSINASYPPRRVSRHSVKMATLNPGNSYS